MAEALPSSELAERMVLAGIVKYGRDGFDEVDTMIRSKSVFTTSLHKDIFTAFKNVFEKDHEVDKISVADLSSEFHNMGLSSSPMDYFGLLLNTPVTSQKELRKYTSVAVKLHIGRQIGEKLLDSARELRNLSGMEKLEQIIGLVEGPLNGLYDTIHDREEVCPLIHNGLDEYLDKLESNPVDQIGIPTGFKYYDAAIGGGIARKSVNVVGARLKTGKSMLLGSMAWNIVQRDIPILNMDTEMSDKQHIHRMLANISGVETNLIKTGKYVYDNTLRTRVRDAANQLKLRPYHYQNVSGWEFEDILSTMKRWVSKTVGKDAAGVTKDCVIFYDYIKLMNTGELNNLAEFQMLGFMMTGLHNFMVKNDVGSVAFCQLNRDGIEEDSSASFAGSDRIGWLCTSLSTLRDKTETELAETEEHGNLKLNVLATREGEGTPAGNYINIYREGKYGRMREGKLAKDASSTTYVEKSKASSIIKDDNRRKVTGDDIAKSILRSVTNTDIPI